MNGSGCKNCPVLVVDTVCDCNYRGHFCLSRRKELGLGDPITKGDRIRSMSDEALAEKMDCPYTMNDIYGECKFGWHSPTQTCFECKLEWLQMSAEEDK